MTTVTDPRTGEPAWISDSDAYWAEKGAELPICTHPEAEMREWTNKNGAIAIVGQCLTCGERVGNPQPKRQGLPKADPSISSRYNADRKVVADRIAITHIDRTLNKDVAWWHRYNAYLETPEWKRRAQLVRNRCDGVCEGCGEGPVDEVHHLTYEHVCEEFLFELVGLCHACHQRAHTEKPPA